MSSSYSNRFSLCGLLDKGEEMHMICSFNIFISCQRGVSWNLSFPLSSVLNRNVIALSYQKLCLCLRIKHYSIVTVWQISSLKNASHVSVLPCEMYILYTYSEKGKTHQGCLSHTRNKPRNGPSGPHRQQSLIYNTEYSISTLSKDTTKADIIQTNITN